MLFIQYALLENKCTALRILHKAKKAYYACDVIRFLVPYAARLKLLVFFCEVYRIEENIKESALDELCVY